MKQKTRILFSYVVLLSCLVRSALSEEVTTKLKILSPKDTIKIDGLKLTVANFGSVPFGRTVIGDVYLAQGPKGRTDACEPILPIERTNTADGKQHESPILIADRGGCTFVMKALNAQLAGAKLLIVADNIAENPEFVLPIDDGYGSTLHIATIMIDKTSGDSLKEYLTKDSTKGLPVTLSVSFDLPKSGKIQYELWITSSDSSSVKMIKELYKFQELLKNKVDFHPHYAVWYCPACQSNNYNAFDNQDCFAGGKYCHPDPDGNGKLTGRDTLLEDLRQMCIRNESNGIAAWWQYYYDFPESSLNSDDLEGASYETMKKIGVNTENVQKCVDKSFDDSNKNTADNHVLNQERATYLSRGILTWPSIIINGATYRGNLEPAKLIFQAMCDAFSELPTECDSAYDEDGFGDITNTNKPSSKKSSSVWLIMSVILIAIIVFALIFIMYKRQMKREILKDMDYQISSTLHRYMAMKDEGEKNVQLSIEA